MDRREALIFLTTLLPLVKKVDGTQKWESKIEELIGKLEGITGEGLEPEFCFDLICIYGGLMGVTNQTSIDMLEYVEELQSLCQVLVVKERQNNEELQDARKALIQGLLEIDHQTSGTNIGIKRIGEIDKKAFINECMVKFSGDDAMIKASQSYYHSLWQKNLFDPAWHPFSIQEADGKTEEVINEDDEKLKKLREEWGDNVWKAVITALQERNAYNPEGSHVMNELWNYKEGRKATLKEVVDEILSRNYKRQSDN